MSLNNYKCRADCHFDIQSFLDLAAKYSAISDPDSEEIVLLGFTLVFKSSWPLIRLQKLMEQEGTDLHVMLETLAPIARYTGERDFDVWTKLDEMEDVVFAEKREFVVSSSSPEKVVIHKVPLRKVIVKPKCSAWGFQ